MRWPVDVPVHQLERLTIFSKNIQGVGFCHIHQVGDLIPDDVLAAVGQSLQVYGEPSSILPISSLRGQAFQAFNVVRQRLVVNGDNFLR